MAFINGSETAARFICMAKGRHGFCSSSLNSIILEFNTGVEGVDGMVEWFMGEGWCVNGAEEDGWQSVLIVGPEVGHSSPK